MHCKTREESEKFLKLLDKAGRKWHIFKESTIYHFNQGSYGNLCEFYSKTFRAKTLIKNLEFDDFDFIEDC